MFSKAFSLLGMLGMSVFLMYGKVTLFKQSIK